MRAPGFSRMRHFSIGTPLDRGGALADRNGVCYRNFSVKNEEAHIVKAVAFTKMHGLGNDYLYIDRRDSSDSVDYHDLAIKMSDRHFGVGGDGIIVILRSERADAKMRIFNADGSESEMCGNGLRALAKWFYDRAQLGAKQAIETGAGILYPEIIEVDHNHRARKIKVNMGPPHLTRSEIGMTEGDPQDTCWDVPLEVNGQTFDISCVSMGNPHAMIFGDVWDQETMAAIGRHIEHHPWFPKRINVHAVQVLDRNHLKMRHWERGAGLTLACGTGVAATVVAAVATGRTDRSVTVDVPGGRLEAEWDQTSNVVFLTGPAVEVCEGFFALR